MENRTLSIGGFEVVMAHSEELKQRLKSLLQHRKPVILLFANTNFIVKCQHLIQPLRRPDILIVNDGVGMEIASRLIHHCNFPENLNGTDFVPKLLHESRATARVFLLGAAPNIAQRAGHTLREKYGVTVCGCRNGYAEATSDRQVIEHINRCGANVLLVGMGNPLQEEWLLHHQREIDAPLLIGVGALFDFLSGEKPRAAPWIQRLRLEWLHRMCLEPGRLARRYTLDLITFLNLCRKQARGSHGGRT
ncbi:MAG: WecB/TagA/CpsF family glycosyltransferase [Pseudomonadota bacterium]|nr:WecB/TagA/CpsF family glycosyltransferase [Pseudomonadota bacterium]